eukprot:TRINITY_DN1058_c2_g2_i1.p1 TRINITY_DN1058_c2_g2~~TRINITY_DN1058_c2_g2_i1.p1  ORF type:complete len:249 (+),score=46.16 TRINITY_DN1058_c2_g2_i1:328-1074(+)
MDQLPHMSSLTNKELNSLSSEKIKFFKKHVTKKYNTEQGSLSAGDLEEMIWQMECIEKEVSKRGTDADLNRLRKALELFPGWKETLRKKIDERRLAEDNIKDRLGSGMGYTVEDRDRENAEFARDLGKQVEEVHATGLVLNNLVEESKEPLEHIDTQMNENVESSNEALAELSKASKNRYGTVGMTFGILSGVLVGGGAAVAGLALAPAVAVAGVGAYAGRAVGKKLGKSAHDSGTAGINAHIASAPK